MQNNIPKNILTQS